MTSNDEYEYVTVAQINRKMRSSTEPPEFSSSNGDDDMGYVITDSFLRVRSNALIDVPRSFDTGKPRKKSIDSQHHIPNLPCLTPFYKLESHFKSLGRKSNTPKQTKDKDKHMQSHTAPRQPMPIPPHNFSRSKSVEDLEATIVTPPITPLQIPIDIKNNHGLSKSKSSSMNILNLNPKKNNVSSPLTNNSTTPEQNSLSSVTPSIDSFDNENIYEELDQLTKREILDKRDTDLGYVTLPFPREGRLRSEERFPNEKRPPAPLPVSIRGAQPVTKQTWEYVKPIPPQKPPMESRFSSKLTENTLDKPRKSPLYRKTSKETIQQDKVNSPKIISTNPASLASLSRNSSIHFTIPLSVSDNTATAVPLYSLQRSENITSELQDITELLSAGFDDFSDEDFSDGEDSLLFNIKPLSIPNSRLMETSLCSDYATYDRIIQDINTYSKQATSMQPVEPDYVSYDNAISNNLTRSRSADLNGYVSAEMLKSQKPKFSLPNTGSDEMEYVNYDMAISKVSPHRNLTNRPDKLPKPELKNSTHTKLSPRVKPTDNKPELSPHKPIENSFEDPGYIGEDAFSMQNRLFPGRSSRKELVQSYHEYADSQMMDSVGALPGEPCFPVGGRFFKSSKRRKSMLRPSRVSRDSSVYTNFTGYVDNKPARGGSKRNFMESDEVEYDYIARTEIRIPFRVSWAPLFFNDDLSYVPSMEVTKLLSALNVTNNINEGWDFHQYSTIVNSKAAKRPPPLHPKTDSLLRENKGMMQMVPFRPSLNCTPEDESVVPLAKHPLAVFNRSSRISFRSSFPTISRLSLSNPTESILASPFFSLPVKPTLHVAKSPSRGRFPSKPMLPPKEAPEHTSIPETTIGRVDENGEFITRSLSESKAVQTQFTDTTPETHSHTLDRYHRNQKKHKQLSSQSQESEMSVGKAEQILAEQGAVFNAAPTKQIIERGRLELRYVTKILLEEDNIIKIPSSAVSLQMTTTDSVNFLKRIGVHEPIEFVIKIFCDYSCWEKKLDTTKKGILREKSVNLSPIVSISCNRKPTPNMGTMLLTIPICGHLDVWRYQLCYRDLDSLYPFERKDESTYKLCDDRVEISAPLFGYYCIRGKYSENCVKKVVFIAFRALFDQNKILIGMSNDTPDDMKLFKEEMHIKHYRAINTEPCQYKLSYTHNPLPLKLTLKIYIQERSQLNTMEIPFMQAWKMVPEFGSLLDDPPTPSCVFTVPTCSHKLDLTVRHGQSCTEFSLNT